MDRRDAGGIKSLKKKIKTLLVLAFLEFESLFALETVTSSVALGVVLVWKKNYGKLQTNQFTPRAMTYQERWYSTSEMEAVGVVLALKKFRVYLLFDKPFLISTNHRALKKRLRRRIFMEVWHYG